MIYLLSEMILALAVAVVLGIAIGWVIHRSAHNKQIQQLRFAIARKNSHLAQTKSELEMLTDDYDDMYRKSHEQIDELRNENRQIPALSTNLEKSQLLVKQMMQRHEAKVRDLTNEKQRLAAKLAKIDQQEQITNQLAAKLDERKRSSTLNAPTSSPTQSDANAIDNADANVEFDLDEQSRSNLQQASSPAELDFADTDVETDVVQTTGSNAENTEHENYQPGKTPLFSAAESEDDPFDKVIEVADDMQRDLDLTTEQKADALTDQSLSFAEDTDDMDAVYELSDIDDTHTDDTATESDLDRTLIFTSGLDATKGSSPHSTSDTQRMDAYLNTNEQNTQAYTTAENDSELPLDGSGDASRLFDAVEQHDDLQQIFGIGPLTEKALNELGITSYSQLAELKQHDVQRIADALEIGQGRIERDNWVGNARRQLEEVLEQL